MKLVLASCTAALQQTRQKAPPISKLFQNFRVHFKADFEIQECPNRKQKKKTLMWQWRNSKGKARLKENGRQMKRQVQVYENLKLGDQYLLINFKQLFTFKMLWLLFKVCFCLKLCLQFLAFSLQKTLVRCLATYQDDIIL